jgi:hypothetical protein
LPSGESAKVISVALTDAVAKDKPSAWSPSMLRLYAIMFLVTISMNSSRSQYLS